MLINDPNIYEIMQARSDREYRQAALGITHAVDRKLYAKDEN